MQPLHPLPIKCLQGHVQQAVGLAWKMWSRISSLLTSRPCRPAVTAA